ncbi:iron-containing alcohol dehydrogenase [Raoultibacter timonensis]|uniref:iron-containing alcohol dehydrogenase n=1 Tax=Raoultibacter timonensis TaxID=1907662 RepID=UPI0026DBD803|nr:iron-containing alcohol dehydrogenase [Raoultibacter timonensis]
MDKFTYEYPTKVLFGVGAAQDHLAQELGFFGGNVMLVFGGGSIKKNGIYDEITGILAKSGKTIVEFGGIQSNPTYDKVQEGAKLARDAKIDFVLAVGGGSVIDCCKVIAAQAPIKEDIWTLEYGECVFPIATALPVGAVVTVSGTGAEMNGGGVITNQELAIKAPLLGATPRFAVLDPAYTLSVPPMQVVSGAFDTLSHAMETYFGVSDEGNSSDDVAEAIMRNTIANIRAFKRNGDDLVARSNLMWDSAMAENGILKVGRRTDFECHMIEHQLGAFTNCNHGQGLAAIHPAYYRRLCKAAPEKFARFAKNVWDIDTTGRSVGEAAEASVAALASFIREIGLPTTLSEMGIADQTILRKVADTCNLNDGGYLKLTRSEVLEILEESL